MLLAAVSGGAHARQQDGLLVEYFDPGAPGARVGVMVGDNLLSYDGVTLISPATLLALEENSRQAAGTGTLRLRREGQEINMSVPRGPLGVVTSMETPEDAHRLYIESWMALQSGNVGESLEKTRTAAQAVLARGDRVRAAWVWWSQGIRYDRAQKWNEAERAYKEALALLEGSPDVAARSRAWSALGNDSIAQGRLGEATERWGKALEIDEGAGYGWWVAGDLMQLARAAQAGGELLRARELGRKAHEAYAGMSPRSPELAGVLNNLGEVARSLGDLHEAEELLTSSLRMKEALAGADPDPPSLLSIAGTLSNLGGVALARGDIKFARDYFARALRPREQYLPEDSPEVAASYSNAGYVEHEDGKIAEAEGYYRRALAIYNRSAPDSAEYAQVLANLGNAAYDRKDYVAAETFYNQVIPIFERAAPGSLDSAKAYHNLGNIQAALHKVETAQANYSRALTIYERLAPESLDLAMVLNSRGAAELDAGRYGEAQALFAHAVSIVEGQRRQIRSTEARAFLVGQRMSEYTGLLRSYIGLRDYARAFETLERARARSLAEQIFEHSFDLEAGAPKDLLNRQRGITERRNADYFRLSRLDPQRDASLIGRLRDEIAGLAVEQRQLTFEVRQASPKYAELQYPDPPGLERMREALDPGTLLLSYFVDDDETYLFAVGKTDLSFYRIAAGRDELARKSAAFMLGVSSPEGVFREAGRSLYDILLRPAQAQIDAAQRILLSPDGPLHKLTFAALVFKPQTEAGASRYFVEMKPLHVVVSMGVYEGLRARSAPADRSQQTVLALGDPAYAPPGGPPAQVVFDCGARRDALAPLPVTREQVQEIKRLFGERATAQLDRDASETNLKRLAPQASIIHIASHGYAENCDPLGSFIVLSQAGGAEEGLLRAFEIMDELRLNADLVTLSACETGLGEITKSEGVTGLTRAFQYAGAKSVVVSLWSVRDTSTSQLMAEFYRQYKDGKSKDEALRLAQVALIGSSQYSHPYHWAAFVLNGHWR